jgi:hypothetical protein
LVLVRCAKLGGRLPAERTARTQVGLGAAGRSQLDHSLLGSCTTLYRRRLPPDLDIAAFSQKFIQNTVDAQTSQGAFTNVSPNTLPFGGGGTEGTSAWNEGMVGAPGWGDAGVIVPWTTWVQYGDKAIIEENWDAMQRWMNFIQSRNLDFLRKNGVGPNFADWLAPTNIRTKTCSRRRTGP